MHALVAIDMSLKDFPVVNARFPRRSGVSQDESGFNFAWIDGHGLPTYPVGAQVNGADTSIQRRIVVLAAGGHLDNLRFDILGNHAYLLEPELVLCETGKRRRCRHHKRGGTRDSRPGRRFRMCLQAESACFRQEWGEKSNYVRRQRMPVRLCLQQPVQVSETVLDTGIQRLELDPAPRQSLDSAACPNI